MDVFEIKELGLYMSSNTAELFAALAKAQGEMDAAPKDARGGRNNRYADLATTIAVSKKPLADNGVCVTQIPSSKNANTASVTTVIGHASGQWIAGGITVDTADRNINGAQAIGSAISYMRRYAYQSMLRMAQDDDDGQGASQPRRQQHQDRRAPQASRQEGPPPPQHGPSHHPSWDAHRTRFCAALGDIGLRYEIVRDFFVDLGRGKPSTWSTSDRENMLHDLITGNGVWIAKFQLYNNRRTGKAAGHDAP